MTVVVLATNGSPACRRAVARTRDLFEGATVVVATVVPGGDAAGVPGVRGIADDLAAHAGRALLADTCRALGGRARPVLLTGDPVDALVDTARTSGAGALVVGSLGGGAIAGVLGTSVGTSLVREAPCSVIALG